MPPSTFNQDTEASEAAQRYSDEIKGKVVLLTGASLKSIGFEAARVIALHAPRQIIFAGRDEARVKAAIDTIQKESHNVDMKPLMVDFSSYKSCRTAASEVLRDYPVIDVLILGHGIMAPPYRKTVEGCESQIGTNHFGPFLFTNLIRPVLMKSAEPRVVVVTSMGHRRSGIRFDDYNFPDGKEYDKWAGYGQSKTANMLFALAIAKRWKKVTAFSVHPGSILGTELSRDLSVKDLMEAGILDKDGKPVQGFYTWKSIPAGASTHIVAAFDQDIKKDNGAYMLDCQVAKDKASPHANDPNLAERLWVLSEKEVGESFP